MLVGNSVIGNLLNEYVQLRLGLWLGSIDCMQCVQYNNNTVFRMTQLECSSYRSKQKAEQMQEFIFGKYQMYNICITR